MSAGSIVALVFAGIFAVLVAFMALVLVRLAQVLVQAKGLVEGVTDRTVPLLGEVTTSVSHVNLELTRVDAITDNVQSITSNVSAMTGIVASVFGSPMVKVAAFSYGVRRATARRRDDDASKALRAELKRTRTARVQARRAGGR